MTIREIIEAVDEVRQNSIDDNKKIKWLSELDMQIYEDIILTHEGATDYMIENADGSFSDRALPYTKDSDELIAPARFSEMYESYLSAKIDYAQSEMNRYSNDSTIHNSAYQAFAAYYNEKHLPLHKERIHTKPTYLRSKNNVFPFD